jgi:hypothetical protein
MPTNILAVRAYDPLVCQIRRISGYDDTARAESDAARVRELAGEAVEAGLDPDDALASAMSAVFGEGEAVDGEDG